MGGGDAAAPIVVMGVSGCGKSTLALSLATALAWPFIEGDAYHPPANVEKMTAGIALTDADLQSWLASLVEVLRTHPQGTVLSCSALKAAYRDTLRQAHAGMRFVFLDLDEVAATQRVAARSGSHFFNPSLVRNQFDNLQRPDAEPGVLCLDAMLPQALLCQQALVWVKGEAPKPEGQRHQRPILAL
ncbi:gluconokinase [Polaromonas sp. OV174]|uniref:gluconokinase n=1 Tax=Polaromonas sp. OV174 TaxID=1855300 RepID=UPI0008E9577B|nr:gluconokinase, GntK/IdnK-type [Polaromonas sp. OV174]SFB83730.1 gluconokinase [Polaromonas sp. OV174]